MQPFQSLTRLLVEQAEVWSDGSLVVDGSVNTLGAMNAAAALAFMHERFAPQPIFGSQQPLKVQAEWLKPSTVAHARQKLLQVLQDELTMYSSSRLGDEALHALIDAFFGEFDRPLCFSNMGSLWSWNSVTAHTRDSLLVVVDQGKVGYWLTFDDE
jgi:hypothetical protein